MNVTSQLYTITIECDGGVTVHQIQAESLQTAYVRSADLLQRIMNQAGREDSRDMIVDDLLARSPVAVDGRVNIWCNDYFSEVENVYVMYYVRTVDDWSEDGDFCLPEDVFYTMIAYAREIYDISQVKGRSIGQALKTWSNQIHQLYWATLSDDHREHLQRLLDAHRPERLGSLCNVWKRRVLLDGFDDEMTILIIRTMPGGSSM